MGQAAHIAGIVLGKVEGSAIDKYIPIHCLDTEEDLRPIKDAEADLRSLSMGYP